MFANTVDLEFGRPVVRTILVCDLVSSTALIDRLGDAPAAGILGQHDRLVRNLLARDGGLEIDKSDGFLLLFERPIEAVRFALAYRAGLRSLSDGASRTIEARVGIHLGEVVLKPAAPADVARGAKPLDVEGLAKSVAARVMSLGHGGQILLTQTAHDLARRAMVGDPDALRFRWATHGAYRLAGLADEWIICEVADTDGPAPMAPADSEKAWRATTATPDQPSATEALNILLVDDHVLIRDALRGVFAEVAPGARVHEAGALAQALELAAKSGELHLAVVDIDLPDGDGLRLIAELQIQHPAISAMVLSGHTDRETVLKALDQGAVGFIPKSAGRAIMLQAFRLVLAGGRYIPPEVLGR